MEGKTCENHQESKTRDSDTRRARCGTLLQAGKTREKIIEGQDLRRDLKQARLGIRISGKNCVPYPEKRSQEGNTISEKQDLAVRRARSRKSLTGGQGQKHIYIYIYQEDIARESDFTKASARK